MGFARSISAQCFEIHLKDGLGRLIDLVRAEPVVAAKHGRSAVVVMAVEAFEKLTRDTVSPAQEKG